MDFLKILKSLEDFVYEALIWILLLPKTLVGILINPRRMTGYARMELAGEDPERFGAAISPPLLLILCVLLAHGVAIAIHAAAPARTDSLADVLLASEQNLLLYRTIAFGLWALAGAVCYLLGARQPIDRRSLRSPFYQQCYLVAPFALASSTGSALLLAGDDSVAAAAGAIAVIAGALWFWLVQIDWLRTQLRWPVPRSVLAASVVLAIGSAANGAVSYLLSHVHVGTSEPPAETR